MTPVPDGARTGRRQETGVTRTLRGRLILSHILPVLLVVPLVGGLLVYLLRTQLWLDILSDELVNQALLTADVAGDRPLIWTNSFEAQSFVSLLDERSTASIALYDSDGEMLASDQDLASGAAALPDAAFVSRALAGEQPADAGSSPRQQVIQVAVPVHDADGRVVGVVYLSQRVSSGQDRFVRVRSLITAGLAGALGLSVIIGLVLALNLGRPLQSVAAAIDGIAGGRQLEALPVRGPEEIRTLLRAFNALAERLRLLERSRRQLLANLVHELGRPLGALQSGLQALKSGADEDPQLRQELLDGMEEQVGRLRPLLDTLADLHGQVLGTLELDLRPVEMGEWLRRTAAPWRQLAEQKGLAWNISVPDTAYLLEIDAARMEQALGNLLSNAVKYTTVGSVSVEAHFEPEYAVIAVSDTGTGIDPAEQAQIFEPFYRSQRDKRFPQGMGLGLSIARDLVTAHGGRLDVESTPGMGSRFALILPRPRAAL